MRVELEERKAWQKNHAARVKPMAHGNLDEKKSSETEDFFISFDPAY